MLDEYYFLFMLWFLYRVAWFIHWIWNWVRELPAFIMPACLKWIRNFKFQCCLSMWFLLFKKCAYTWSFLINFLLLIWLLYFMFFWLILIHYIWTSIWSKFIFGKPRITCLWYFAAGHFVVSLKVPITDTMLLSMDNNSTPLHYTGSSVIPSLTWNGFGRFQFLKISFRMSKHVASNLVYSRCGDANENILHVPTDCNLSTLVWEALHFTVVPFCFVTWRSYSSIYHILFAKFS